MPLLFNESEIAKQDIGGGVSQQPLIDETRTGNDFINLYRYEIGRQAELALRLAQTDFAWTQLLSGAGSLSGDAQAELTPDHIALLPPGFTGAFTASEPSVLLLAEVPRAARFDDGFKTEPPVLRIHDWTREPVLSSEHDARQRIYLASTNLFGTEAFKGEMIIYPPGTTASKHYHEGAEHFQYVLSGSGTVFFDDEPKSIQAGDVIYNYEHEWHHFENRNDEDMVFVEFFVPGNCETVWAPDAEVCTWHPTGKDIRSRTPVRDIRSHVHGRGAGDI